MNNIAIFVANEFEDVELIASLDIFKRANVSYTIFSVENLQEVKGKYEAIVKTKVMSKFDGQNFNALFLPGGPGYLKLKNSKELLEIIRDFKKQNKVLAAICAAPDVLVEAGVIRQEVITSFPGHAKVQNNSGNEVEVSGNLITGRDFKATINFAEVVVEVLNGRR